MKTSIINHPPFTSRPNVQYWGLTGQKLEVAVATLAGLGFLLFGYDQGVMGGLLTLPSFVETFPELDTISSNLSAGQKSSNSTLLGASVALYEIGCMIGALSCLYVGDKFGRRKVIFAGALVMIVGAVLQCSAFSLAQLIVGRIVSGVGNGWITATVPTWQAECSKAHKRGKLVMIEGVLITAGITISYWLDIVFALIISCTVLYLPESPRWLVRSGQSDEARLVFSAFENLPPNNPAVSNLVQEIEKSLQYQTNSSGGAKMLLTNGPKRNFHRASLGVLIQAFSQFSGINTVTFYAATIYESYLGLSPVLSRLLAACNGTEYFICSWFAVYTIERFGRRKLLLAGSFGMTSTMALLAATAWAADPVVGLNSKPAAVVAATLMFVFNTFFAIGWLGIPWLYPAEIVPLETRAAANGISTACNWILNFATVFMVPITFQSIGWKTYLIFASTNLLIIPCVYFLFPETAGRSLEELDEIFACSSWLSVVSEARTKHRPLKSTLHFAAFLEKEEQDNFPPPIPFKF